jgi:hypothetical protein
LTAGTLSEVFHCIVLISDGNGRSRIGQAECRARTVFKIDFELGLGFTNGFYFTALDPPNDSGIK